MAILLTKQTEPSTPALNKSIMYVDTSDNHIKVKDENGDVHDLVAAKGEIVHGFSVDNGTEVLTAGIKGYFVMPYDYLITGWSIIGNTTGSATIDIWKAHDAIPTSLDTITGTAKPAVTNDQYQTSTTLTNWDTSISAGDIVAYYLEDVQDFNLLTFQLNVIRI